MPLKQGEELERVDIDGLTITYERAGSGPLLMLLHGYLGDGPSVWRHQIDELASEFTVDEPKAIQAAETMIARLGIG